jgi:hypothetical protein
MSPLAAEVPDALLRQLDLPPELVSLLAPVYPAIAAAAERRALD